jgi:hypothetical protein
LILFTGLLLTGFWGTSRVVKLGGEDVAFFNIEMEEEIRRVDFRGAAEVSALKVASSLPIGVDSTKKRLDERLLTSD